MKTAFQLLALGTSSLLCAAAMGQAAVDTSTWECKLCRFDDGVSGTLELGGGNVSDSASKSGEYNGLHEQGGFLVADGAARYRGTGAAYWNVNAANLGLDTRRLAAEGGLQGTYKLLLHYDESPHFVSGSARTPFIGNGDRSLTLPAGFPAGTTGLMPLAGTLQPVDLETKRQELGAGASWTPVRAWMYAVDFSHRTRDGTKGAAGTYFVNASQLVAPVDDVTDQVNASATYTGAKLQARFAYGGSWFRNNDASLTWQNPFTVPAFPGAVAGQLALPADNEFHQVSASAGYQFTDRTRATAEIAYGRMEQDDTFLAPTLDTTLAAPPLPRLSLDGRVNVFNGNVQLHTAITDRLRLKAVYSRSERDNDTPQAEYAWVTTDMFLATPRTNLPYSFTQDRVKLRADYQAPAHIKASLGLDHDSDTRTFQEAHRTREDTIWGKVAAHALRRIDVTLKFAHAERDNSGYEPVDSMTPPENPLLRKYNMADRTRDSAELRADIAATDRMDIGLEADASEDDYSDSAIGLVSGRDLNLNADVTLALNGQTSLHLFASHQVIKSKQAGSEAFATPDWQDENRDKIDFAGIGLRRAAIGDRLDVGADYTYTRSRSETRIDRGVIEPGFPDQSTSRHSLKLHATCRLRENWSLRAEYWYEHYDSEDWMFDGVAPDTTPNVLTLGRQSPQDRVHVVALSAKYRF